MSQPWTAVSTAKSEFSKCKTEPKRKIQIRDGFDKTLKSHFLKTGGPMGCLYERVLAAGKVIHVHVGLVSWRLVQFVPILSNFIVTFLPIFFSTFANFFQFLPIFWGKYAIMAHHDTSRCVMVHHHDASWRVRPGCQPVILRRPERCLSIKFHVCRRFTQFQWDINIAALYIRILDYCH